MSVTQMLTTDALAVKLWAKKDWLNMGQRTAFGHMMDRGSVYFPEELLGQRAKGDEITFPYINKLTGIPIGEGGVLDGNEEALNLQSYKMAMGMTRVGVLNPNDEDTIESQRTNLNFENLSRRLISNRQVELLDTAVFYQLAGANPNTLTINGTTWSGTNRRFVNGFNTPVPASTNRVYRPAGAANDQSLTSANTITLEMIDYLLEKNYNSDQPIQPHDDGTYDLYISPEQEVDLKLDNTGRVQWYNIQLAAIAGGKDSVLDGSASFNRGQQLLLGRYGQVNIYRAPRAAYGVNSGTGAVITTVRRAVLLGKDALTFASPFGGRMTDEGVPLKYKTQLKDYEYYKGIEGRLIYGIKKMVPTGGGEDVGVYVLATYAAAHS